MAVSDYDFSRTRNEVIEAAYQKVGAHRRGKTFNGNFLQDGIHALNDMVSEWQNHSVFLWTVKELSFPTVATTKSYALSTDPKVIDVQDVYLDDDSDNQRTPIEVISWSKYLKLPDPDDQNEPCKAAIDRKDSPTMYLWPVPNAVNTIYYTAVCTLKDFDTANSLEDFSARWNLALIYGLAALLADDFKLPMDERRRLDDKALEYLEKAKIGDRDEAEREFVRGAFGK